MRARGVVWSWTALGEARRSEGVGVDACILAVYVAEKGQLVIGTFDRACAPEPAIGMLVECVEESSNHGSDARLTSWRIWRAARS